MQFFAITPVRNPNTGRAAYQLTFDTTGQELFTFFMTVLAGSAFDSHHKIAAGMASKDADEHVVVIMNPSAVRLLADALRENDTFGAALEDIEYALANEEAEETAAAEPSASDENRSDAENTASLDVQVLQQQVEVLKQMLVAAGVGEAVVDGALAQIASQA